MKRVSFYIKVTLILFFVFFSYLGKGQDLLRVNDLSQMKVDALSASDISKLKNQLKNSGLSIDQAEQMAIAKGLPSAEAEKLKLRLTSTPTTSNGVKFGNEKNIKRENANPEDIDTNKESRESSLIDPLIFGSELYTNAALSFEPDLKIATPINYILGPEDQISISVFGVQEYNESLQISPEGVIYIPNVGEVKLAGLTIEAATQKLKSVMGNSVYRYLKTGESKLSISLTKIKTINVTIIGSNRPGNYKVSSFSSVFNALYAAGGPSKNGSFREIELIRNYKIVKKIDLYRFLINGDQSDNIGLKDNDVLRIPVYKNRIEIQGQVKRPGFFELLPNETISNLIEFANGFTDSAYKVAIKVFRRGGKQREIYDLSESDFSKIQPRSGDVFIVSKTLDRFLNRITLKGAVYRPDIYELTPNLSVADLVRKADGLKKDAYTERAQILRFDENLNRQIISININKALKGDTSQNKFLKPDDEVIISSIFDLKDLFKVKIQGEIRKPGSYDYIDKLTLKDLIIQAGGFTDAALKKVEIARIIKRDSISSLDERSVNMINVSVSNDSLETAGSNLEIQPFDVITVRRMASYQLPETIIVTGQIQFPGPYTLNFNHERVSDIIRRAGGFAPQAFLEGAFIKRVKNDYEIEKAKESAQKLKRNSTDSTGSVTQDILREVDKIPLDLVGILKNPGSSADVILKSFDELVIPKFDEQVRISGEVLLSTQVPYNSNNNFKDYINMAGGFSTSALSSKSYVVYANGSASRTKKFLFFKSYPKVLPGSEVVVPRKSEQKPISIAEIAGFATVILSLVSTYVLLKK